MGYVFFWFALAMLVGVYANSKGRFGFGYFLLALLLSPLIGFIIVAVLDPAKAELEQKAISQGDMKKCPDCAELVKKEARICKHCKHQFA